MDVTQNRTHQIAESGAAHLDQRPWTQADAPALQLQMDHRILAQATYLRAQPNSCISVDHTILWLQFTPICLLPLPP